MPSMSREISAWVETLLEDLPPNVVDQKGVTFKPCPRRFWDTNSQKLGKRSP